MMDFVNRRFWPFADRMTVDINADHLLCKGVKRLPG